MALWILDWCEEHHRTEQMVVLYDRKLEAYGCLPACRMCILENDNYIVFKNWEEAVSHSHHS